METVVEGAIWALLLFFAVVFFLGVIGIACSGLAAPEDRRKKSKGGLGKAFLAGILLGIWLDD
ncbi:MAG: hypothetical protein HY306_03105 [Nitrosomonadales bacterium]|nr:hypothetical protein [Nitrosomonadales bacterium]